MSKELNRDRFPYQDVWSVFTELASVAGELSSLDETTNAIRIARAMQRLEKTLPLVPEATEIVRKWLGYRLAEGEPRHEALEFVDALRECLVRRDFQSASRGNGRVSGDE